MILVCIIGYYGKKCFSFCFLSCNEICVYIDGLCNSCNEGLESCCYKGRYICFFFERYFLVNVFLNWYVNVIYSWIMLRCLGKLLY